MRLEVAGNDPTVVRVTKRIFDALDTAPGNDLDVDASAGPPLDPITALLALRNAVLTVGCVAIDAGAQLDAENAPAEGQAFSAAERNRQMVLTVVKELRDAIVSYQVRPRRSRKLVSLH